MNIGIRGMTREEISDRIVRSIPFVTRRIRMCSGVDRILFKKGIDVDKVIRRSNPYKVKISEG